MPSLVPTGKEIETANVDLMGALQGTFQTNLPQPLQGHIGSCREEMSRGVVKSDLTATRETTVSPHKG